MDEKTISHLKDRIDHLISRQVYFRKKSIIPDITGKSRYLYKTWELDCKSRRKELEKFLREMG